MLLKLGAQGRLLYIALQRSAATAFEYDAAADRLSTIVELNGSCETVTYSGGPELVARKYGCSEKDTLAVENAFGLAVDGEDAEVDFRDLRAGGQSFKRMSLYVMSAPCAAASPVSCPCGSFSTARSACRMASAPAAPTL